MQRGNRRRWDGKGVYMTTFNLTSATATTNVMSVVFVAFMGAALVFAAGFAQSQTLHDAAHDMRHSTGFPCH